MVHLIIPLLCQKYLWYGHIPQIILGFPGKKIKKMLSKVFKKTYKK